MAISATMVRELREMTGAAMMDCKKALEAAGGDLQQAIDHLRKQGLKSAAKKAARDTGEGRLVAVLSRDRRRGHLVGIACETDFLAGSERFRELMTGLENHVGSQDPDDIEDGARPLLKQSWQGAGATVAETLQEAVGQFGENLRIHALVRLDNQKGRIGAYIHHDHRQAAIVSVTTAADPAAAEEVLKSLCQHIVVFQPSYANRAEVPAEDIEREKAVIRESDDVKKRPPEFQDKIIEGKLSKFYATTVLAEQPWIHDDKLTVQKALAKELGGSAKIEAFRRVAIGT